MTRRFLTVAILPLLVLITAYHIAPVDNAELQAEEPDVVDTEENAAKLLARVFKGQLDGTVPAAEWPETIRKTRNAWIVDVDTQALPSGYPEQIIIETIAAGGHTGIAKRPSGTQQPANSPMVFKSARIRLFHLPNGVPENFASDAATKVFVDPTDPKPMAISDQGSVNKLVACFPGVGSKLKSPNAGRWEACGEVVFVGVDSTEVTVKFNDDLSSWSEGTGDFDFETPETLRGFILSTKAQDVKAKTEAQTSDDGRLEAVAKKKADTDRRVFVGGANYKLRFELVETGQWRLGDQSLRETSRSEHTISLAADNGDLYRIHSDALYGRNKSNKWFLHGAGKWVQDEKWMWFPERASIAYSLLNKPAGYGVQLARPAEWAANGNRVQVKIVKAEKTIHQWDTHFGGAFVFSGSTLVYSNHLEAAPGCELIAWDLESGKQLWATSLKAVPAGPTSRYRNQINLKIQDDEIIVYGDESRGQYIEKVDLETGKTIYHSLGPDQNQRFPGRDALFETELTSDKFTNTAKLRHTCCEVGTRQDWLDAKSALVADLKIRFSGVDARATGSEADRHGKTFSDLMVEWNPIRFSPNDLKAIAGAPTNETANELRYDFDNGWDGSYWKFKVEGDTIVSVTYTPGD